MGSDSCGSVDGMVDAPPVICGSLLGHEETEMAEGGFLPFRKTVQPG